MRLLVFAFATLISVVSAACADEPAALSPTLTSENLAAWTAHIRPSESELAPLRTIPWRLTFADGLEAAAEAGKPVLLWTMNGHPLGCT